VTRIPGVYVGNPSKQDLRELKLYSLAVIGGALIVGHMVYITWLNGAWQFVADFATATFLPDGLTGSKAIILFGTGIYFGLLGLFANDHRKRYQGIPVLLGSIAFIGFLGILGIGVVNFDLTLLNVLSLASGLAVGISVELIPVERTPMNGDLQYINFENSLIGRAANDRGESLEFKAAALGLKAYIIGLIIIGNLLNIVLSLPTPSLLQVIHLVASGAFLYFLNGFIDIDVTPNREGRKFEVIGPKQSGKSYLTLGLFLTATNNNVYSIKGWNDDFGDLRQEYQDLTYYADSDSELTWNIAGNTEEEIRKYGFELEYGEIAPRRCHFSVIDYGGELLDDIGTTISKGQLVSDGGDRAEDKDEVSDPVGPFRNEDHQKDEIVDAEPGTVEDGEIYKNEDVTDDQWPDSVHENNGTESESEPTEDRSASSSDNENFGGINYDEEPDSDTTTGVDTIEDGFSSSGSATTDDAEQEDESDPRDQAIETVIKNIRGSDRLLMLIDGERFYGEEPVGPGSNQLEIEPMRQIAKNANVAEVVPVVTKADHFIEDFKSSHEHIDQVPTDDNHWNEFREFVTTEVKNDGLTSPFLGVLDSDTVYPVYYHTEEREVRISPVDSDGDSEAETETRIMPEPGPRGELQPEGYENLLEYITGDR